MGTTRFSGPILGSSEAMAGALEDGPIGVVANTQWVEYFNDFSLLDADYDTTTDWSLTQVSGGGSAAIIKTVANSDTGILRLDCPADNDGPIVQLDGSVAAGLSPLGVTPTAAVSGTSAPTDAIFASRFRILDVSGSGVFVGLAELNGTSAIMATPEGGVTSDTHIGFAQKDSDAGSIYFTVAGDDDTAAVTDTTVLSSALADSEFVEIAVRATGVDRYRGYVRSGGQDRKWTKVIDGTLASGNTWDAQMLISLVNIGGGVGDDLDIDYVYFAQKRDLIA
tara:strand:- start:18 stop:857 length:840 start_codon:yes stop_codon:yes gene_type:complete